MKLYLRLAWRNLWRHRTRTLIVVLSIGLTQAAIMMYDGLVTGFNDAIYAGAIKVLGGNIQVHAAGYRSQAGSLPLLPLPDPQAVIAAAKAQPQVVAATRRINTGGMATNREGAFGVTIVGIEPEAEAPVLLQAQNISSGSYLTAAAEDKVFIGQGLAKAMDARVGDRITLVGRSAHEQMRSRTMTITGIYDLGIPDVEKQTVFISLAEAQLLYGLTGQVTEVAITLKNLGQEAGVISGMKPRLSGIEIDDWTTNYPELKMALTNKNGVMNIFSVIIFFIAGIGILNLLLMAVYERTREIGVLAALGMKPRQIAWLFVLEGAMMGLVGVAFGVLLGIGLNGIFGQVGFDYSSFAGVTDYMALISGRIYPTLGLENITMRTLTAVTIAVLAALIPAREASLSEPAQALHYV